MARTPTTNLKELSIFWLNQEGFLSGGVKTGGIRWLRGQDERGAADLAGVVLDDFRFVRVHYWIDDGDSKGSREYIHEIPLTTTQCFFSLERFWFLCPLCHTRRGILYLNKGEIGCRECYDLAYESQQNWWHGWYSRLNRTLGRAMEAEEKLETLRVKMWKGKPTKHVVRLMQALDLTTQ